MRRQWNPCKQVVISFTLVLLAGCAGRGTGGSVYVESRMDFASLQSVAVLPFQNLSGQQFAGERVRDAFTGMLLATGALYVLPPGEVSRGLGMIGRYPPEGPTTEQIKKLAGILGVDAVITGVVTEYGPVRSGAATANVISVSLQMIEVENGLVVWSASTTRGGITVWNRLVGSGGSPMTAVTRRAMNDLLNKLFQ